MATILWIIVVVVLAFLFIRLTILLVKSSTVVVREGEAVVINRLGRFNRVAGPGTVVVIPKLENIQRTIEIRNHPLDVTISDIPAYGVPYNITLNFWCSFEPQKLAGRNKARLAELVGTKESERQSQIEIKLRDMLERQIAILQQHMPMPGKSADRISALAPGSSRYNAFKKRLTNEPNELAKTLSSLGITLDTTRSIILTIQNLSDNDTPPSRLPADEPQLTKHDLAILKSIPRNEA